MLRPKRKIIISVHGIRTRGAWQKELASIVSEKGWIYFPLDYGYFNALQFALPFSRRGKIEWFRDEYTNIQARYPDIAPSVVAHSNGTYIVANALLQFDYIKVDKIILCGSIVRRDFAWKTIFERKQATLVRNEVGLKDIWAQNVHRLAWGDSGPSGQKGFLKDVVNPNQASRLKEPSFPFAKHDSFQAALHYRKHWLPFLEEGEPYEGEKDPPWYSEEPVGPQDAARWSAMTYFYQYVSRVNSAIANDKAMDKTTKTPIPAKKLWVIVPQMPGQADKDAIEQFYKKHGLKNGETDDKDSRSFRYNLGEIIYDIPTTLNTLRFLDHRKDDELVEAVTEFEKWLIKLVNGSRSQCADTVEIKRVGELPEMLP